MKTTVPRGQTPERRAYMKAYTESHTSPDRGAYKADYDASHSVEAAAWRAANSDRIKQVKLAYYRKHRDQILAKVKAWCDSNPSRISTTHAIHYSRNAERIRDAVKAYRTANPEKKAVLESRRRARKAGNGGSHTAAERRDKFASLGNVCVYCGIGGKLTVDHVVPLKLGGTDDIGNIVPACQSCNSRKNAKTLEDFCRTNHAAIGGVGRKPETEYQGR